MMKDADEDPDKAPLYSVEVFERQFALIELAIKKYTFYDLLHMVFDPLRSGVFKDAGRRFHCVGKHDDACLLRLRFRTGVPEVFLLDHVQ